MATTAASLPVFLVAASSVLIRSDFGFSERQLGLAVSSYFLAAALVSIPAGRFAERLGPRMGLSVGAAIVALALAALAFRVGSYADLVWILMLAGTGSAITEPASNLAIASEVTPARQGMLFGWKQSAVPLGGVVAGLSLPLIALNFGWRASIAVSILIPILALGALQLSPPMRVRARVVNARVVDRQLLLLTLTVGLGMAAVTSLQTFFVESAVASGVQPGRAGTLLAAGAVLGIFSRVFFGWRADRASRTSLQILAALMAVGGVGYGFLAIPSNSILVLGSTLAFFAGWGWTGIFQLSVIRIKPLAPAAATGVTSTGGRIGGVVGPLLFGVVAARSGYGAAWMMMASFLVLAAITAIGGEAMAGRES